MTREQRLFERLINIDELPERSLKSNVEALVRSVMDHLVKILNTRQGTVLSDPEYGSPEVLNLPGNFVSPETLALQKNLKQVIEKFEPRLKDVEISFAGASDDDLSICFTLKATIYHLEHVVPIQFQTRIKANRSFDINLVR